MFTRPETTTKLLTYEEYLRLPEIMQRYEIIDGEMILSPGPTSVHQWDMSQLLDQLRKFVKRHQLGVVLPSPVDVIIQKTPKLRTRQPDILFLSTARSGVRGRQDLKRMPQIEIAPDLVVEILSPDEQRKELIGKLTDYAGLGVLEVWLLDSDNQTIEILALKENKYERSGFFGREENIASAVLPGFELPVHIIFDEPY